MSKLAFSSSVIVQASAISLLIVSGSLSLNAQSSANCTFTTFDPPSGYIYGFAPMGINDYSTIVGGVDGPTESTEKAYIRYSGGGVTLFSVPKATWTILNRRNRAGTSVGAYGSGPQTPLQGSGSNGLIYTSSSYATLDYPGSPATELNGIDKWNTIVGTAVDPKTNQTFGFKYENGKFTQIKYPGATQTTVNGINDNGVIVGGYQTGTNTNLWSGYALQNGKFTNLKSFVPGDINIWGTMVAYNEIRWADGTTKIIYLPGSANTSADGINNEGVITGFASYGTFEFQGFTAKCK